MKFKVGDKANCNRDEPGWVEWQDALVIKVYKGGDTIFVECTCDTLGNPGEIGLFYEDELDLAETA